MQLGVCQLFIEQFSWNLFIVFYEFENPPWARPMSTVSEKYSAKFNLIHERDQRACLLRIFFRHFISVLLLQIYNHDLFTWLTDLLMNKFFN